MRWFPILGALFSVLALVGLVWLGYSVSWTGFGPSVNATGDLIPGKSLWDWLDLLVVPLFLALAAWLLDSSRKKSDLRVEADRQQQSTLDGYLEFMTKMLVEKTLPGKNTDVSRSIARTRTLTVLRSLNGGRRAQLLQFLYEAGLIGPEPIVQLNGADLSGAILDEAVLRGAELRGVHFEDGSLRNATLAGADLRGSDFSRADFTGADLEAVNFTQAILADAIVTAVSLAAAVTDQAVFPKSIEADRG